LLSIDDALHPLFAAHHKRSEVVVAVMLDRRPRIVFVPRIQERRGEITNQLLDVLLLPAVFALKVVDGVLPFVEDIEDGAVVCVDFVVLYRGVSGRDTHGNYCRLGYGTKPAKD
jgi:hypothetical protein